MSKPPLSDREIYDLLHEAQRLFIGRSGETTHGETVIKATLKTLSGMQLGILLIEAKAGQTPLPRDPE